MTVLAAGPQTTFAHPLEGLRLATIEGQLRPAERLAEEHFAGALGVSIAPVREALRVLEQEGQVLRCILR